MNVTKRNGSQETLDIDKINKVLQWAVEGISNVSITDIVANAKLNFYEGITTDKIHALLINSAVNLFNEEKSNYQLVASRLLNIQLRKSVWGDIAPPSLKTIVEANVLRGIYEPELLNWYSDEEFEYLNKCINHDRDFIPYSGIKQLCDKYLVQNRKTKEIYETPQFAYMLVAMTGFHRYTGKTRLKYVTDAYEMFSKQQINLPTPQIAGLRTTTRQFASCALFEVDDDMDSIVANLGATMKATADRYGLGIGMSKIRSIGSEIRGGEVIHTGVIPFLKVFEGGTKSCQQAGLRGGSATVNFPIFHPEILDILVLKNNSGTEDNRVRKLDYAIHLSKLFYTRFMKGQKITLFNYNEAPDLYDAFGLPEFDELYEKYEKRTDLKMKSQVDASEIFSLFFKERAETGRIYPIHIDHINQHGSFKDQVRMVNLCVEIAQPTVPIKYLEDPEGEVGVCVLAALNLVNIKNDSDFEKVCEIVVRLLEEIIDYQVYPIPAMENFAKKRRSLGIGVTNLAAFLAKNGYLYTDEDTPNFIDSIGEKLQFFTLKASMLLAKERGPCEKYDRTKYSDGIFTIDTYKKDVDAIITRAPSFDWDWLRGEVAIYGLRHSTVTAQMPCESSSVIQNSTNGIEPVRSLITFKGSKVNILPVLVPEHKKWKYQLAFDICDNKALINVSAAFQKWMDMNLSTNTYYSQAGENTVSDMAIAKDMLYAYKMGCKVIYYHNTDDGSGSRDSKNDINCASGACAI